MTARKNANAGPRFHEDPNLPEGRQDITLYPIRLTQVPDHPRPGRRSATTPIAAFRRKSERPA